MNSPSTQVAPPKAAPKSTPAKAPEKAKASKPTPEAEAPKTKPTTKVMASTDANHQQWQLLKKELTSVLSDLLYDSRRVNPEYSKSQEEATAKVSSAIKALEEFTKSVRIK